MLETRKLTDKSVSAPASKILFIQMNIHELLLVSHIRNESISEIVGLSH